MNEIKIEASWKHRLISEFKSDYMLELATFLREEKSKGKEIYPLGGLIFNAFNLTSFNNVKVVIIGQDPYHGYGQAHGLSFSVQRNIATPPSLHNIFQELKQDLNISIPVHGNLEKWSQQGVLLLNTCLTVQKGCPGSHQGKGWEKFTNAVLCKLNEEKENIVFILWGRKAQEKEKLINFNRHLVISSSHPSPFSANYGFFGSKPFSKTNTYLERNNISPIDWSV